MKESEDHPSGSERLLINFIVTFGFFPLSTHARDKLLKPTKKTSVELSDVKCQELAEQTDLWKSPNNIHSAPK